MTLRIVGAGFGRTGTMSLKLALEELGLRACYHMTELAAHPQHAPLWLAFTRGERVDLEQIFAGYAAAVDWPACVLWRDLDRAKPRGLVREFQQNHPRAQRESAAHREPGHSRALRLEPRGDPSPNIRRPRKRPEPCDLGIQGSQRSRDRGATRRQTARLRRSVGLGCALRFPRLTDSGPSFSARERR
jgi:hypothetical protein